MTYHARTPVQLEHLQQSTLHQARLRADTNYSPNCVQAIVVIPGSSPSPDHRAIPSDPSTPQTSVIQVCRMVLLAYHEIPVHLYGSPSYVEVHLPSS
jgi:hypothetical protein